MLCNEHTNKQAYFSFNTQLVNVNGVELK